MDLTVFRAGSFEVGQLVRLGRIVARDATTFAGGLALVLGDVVERGTMPHDGIQCALVHALDTADTCRSCVASLVPFRPIPPVGRKPGISALFVALVGDTAFIPSP